ncbi:MAG: DNA repair protein RecN [Ardenticatenaceae bacterium]|nr:DNA repair protein RecN [Ardenticatenaceae bacterium]
MLTELYIRNFAIIEELRLAFDPGFNVLTGETGAGKSIILDAVMLVLGGRADTTMVRAEAPEAYVEATFKLSSDLQTAVHPLLLAEGLEDEEAPDTLVLARELRLNGRNFCRVNGRTVNLSLLRDLAEPLIDIHGQGEHLSLLKPRSHLPLLDSYAGLVSEQRTLAKEVAALQKVQRELADLRRDARTIAQRIDILKYQLEEIDAAKLKPDEEEELKLERDRLANSEHLSRAATEVIALFTGMDNDEANSVVDMMGQAEKALTQLSRYDETQTAVLERVQGLSFQINEVAAELQDYLDEVEFNPKRLNQVEERLEAINRLKRKYGDTIEAILETRDNAAAELKKLENSEIRTGELEEEQERYLRQIGKLAQALSQKRQKAAQELSKNVERPLAELGMEGARFSVQFECVPDSNGVYVNGDRLAFDSMGIDRAEFLISTNPGEPLKPMAKVASGGETARLMLSLKTALAQVDRTPTLIFDEIDQGIGGRIGDVVGRKLWGLTAVANHQVIVVTHLPQLAGYGDVHFHVSKQVHHERTITSVHNLDITGRVHELANMLGTGREHAEGGAKSILEQAKQAKANHKQSHS